MAFGSIGWSDILGFLHSNIGLSCCLSSACEGKKGTWEAVETFMMADLPTYSTIQTCIVIYRVLY